MRPDHSIPIHRAANRPVLLLGCDRELIGLVLGSSIAPYLDWSDMEQCGLRSFPLCV